MPHGRRIAFDFGGVRVGVAISDSDGIIASPRKFIENDRDFDKNLKSILESEDPIYIAVGIPKHLSGALGSTASDTMKFVEKLKVISDTPIYGIDERLTSVTAASKLRESGKDSRESKDLIDSASAVEILEMALEFEKNGSLPNCVL
jgi:putative holliday junction resolvase